MPRGSACSSAVDTTQASLGMADALGFARLTGSRPASENVPWAMRPRQDGHGRLALKQVLVIGRQRLEAGKSLPV